VLLSFQNFLAAHKEEGFEKTSKISKTIGDGTNPPK
jgi:hypothetical protein